MIAVAAYCRVSTEKEDQANSFKVQKAYFREYIENHENWELFEIYADEGITGTSTKKRTQFNRMLEDAQRGKFQLLLTKEVSRFARNILDTISFTRQLRELGVRVIFTADGIDTTDPDAELRLSILGSIAQEESRRTSQRVKWGQTRQMERGVVFGHSLIGYDVTGGKISIEPKGAEIVRLIFRKYALEKKNSAVIARELEKATGSSWTPNRVLRILKNEKYVGDLVQKKTYTPNYLTHEKKINQGQEPIIILRDHHLPIVSRTLWNKAQDEIKNRRRQSEKGESCTMRYSLSGKIHCGQCGRTFVSKIKKRKDGSICRRWCCSGSGTCKIGKSLRDSLAKETFYTVVQSMITDKSSMAKDIADLVFEAITRGREVSQRRQQEERERIIQKMDKVLELSCTGQISKAELSQTYLRYQAKINLLSLPAADISFSKVDLEKSVLKILKGEIESDVFIRTILSKITMFSDKHLELWIDSIRQPWCFSFL